MNEIPKKLSDIINAQLQLGKDAKAILPDPRKEWEDAKEILKALLESGAVDLLKKLYLYVSSVPDLSHNGAKANLINYIKVENPETLILANKENHLGFKVSVRGHRDDLTSNPPSVGSLLTYNHMSWWEEGSPAYFGGAPSRGFEVSWNDSLEAYYYNKEIVISRMRTDRNSFLREFVNDYQTVNIPPNNRQEIDRVLGEFYQKQPALPFDKLFDRRKSYK
jgi:hypothetical protein